MKKVLFSVKPHKLKILDQMDSLRGNTPRSAFILQSIEYMIDTHKKNADLGVFPLKLSIWSSIFSLCGLTEKSTFFIDT
jgi:hypothetical protein